MNERVSEDTTQLVGRNLPASSRSSRRTFSCRTSSGIQVRDLYTSQQEKISEVMSAKVQANGEIVAAQPPTEGQASLLPHLESLDRMLKLPVVDATWQQTQNVYGRVKGRWFDLRIPIVCNRDAYC